MPDSTTLQPRRSTWVLCLLLLLFAAPLALSWWMYNFTELGRDGGAYSHGDLILPPRVVSDLPLLDPVTGMRRQVRGKWNLVYLAESGCDSRCEQRLYMMRQLWLAMGRDAQGRRGSHSGYFHPGGRRSPAERGQTVSDRSSG